MYHWIDNETGEIHHNIWNVIFGDIWELIWCIRNKHKPWSHKWHYSKKGW